MRRRSFIKSAIGAMAGFLGIGTSAVLGGLKTADDFKNLSHDYIYDRHPQRHYGTMWIVTFDEKGRTKTMYPRRND